MDTVIRAGCANKRQDSNGQDVSHVHEYGDSRWLNVLKMLVVVKL